MSRKDFITVSIIVIVLGIAYYLISPVWRVKEVNEPFPGPVISDNFNKMDDETEAAFNKAMLEANETPAKPKNDGMADEAFALLARGDFAARAHNVAGTAILLKIGEGKILRFEDFDTINGPNLHIYLAADLSDRDYVDLGEIRGTKGNINYTVDDSIDTSKYRYVLVWCVPFRILFSYAELK